MKIDLCRGKTWQDDKRKRYKSWLCLEKGLCFATPKICWNLCAKQGVLGCDVGKKKMRACYCHKMCGKCLGRLGAQHDIRKRGEACER